MCSSDLTTIVGSNTGVIEFGRYSTNYYTGYIDDFRLTINIARYTGNFTVPTQAYPNAGFVGSSSYDPFFFSTSLLLHMDGSNGGTTFTDSSLNGLTVTPTNATTSTTQVKYGTASGYFNGTSAYLTLPSSTDINLTGDFTIESWVYLTSTPSFSMVIGDNYGGGDYIAITPTAVNLGMDGGPYLQWNYSFSANNWYHLAVCRSGTSFAAFVNGVMLSLTSGTNNSSATFLRSTVFIGKYGGSPAYYFPGYMDDFRITKGVARYTGT